MNWFKLNNIKDPVILKLNGDDKAIKSLSSVELLGIIISDKFNFNFHIDNICRLVAYQGNALTKLKLLLNSYILSNFNYYPLVWMFCSLKFVNKIKSLQKRPLRFFLADSILCYVDSLEKRGKVKWTFHG